MNFLKLIQVIFSLFLVTVFNTVTLAEDKVKYNIYLTRQVEHQQPTRKATTEFNCTDRIYVVVEAQGLASKKHQLLVQWVNPVGEQQERTKYEFNAHPFTRIWAWLQLSGPPGAVIGQVFDPAFGMEDFIGKWHSKISINNEKIEDLEFNVLC